MAPTKAATALSKYRIPLEQLKPICDPAQFDFASTAELGFSGEIIGQERATRALAFGLDIPSYGFNIYALGAAGVGKTTTVKRFLSQRASQESTPDDWCYVNDFQHSRRPKALRLPAGRGRAFRQDMADLLARIKVEIPRAFESNFFQQRRKELEEDLRARQAGPLEQLEKHLQARGFALGQTKQGLSIVPMLEGKALNSEQYQRLPSEVKIRFETQRPELEAALADAVQQAHEAEETAEKALSTLKTEVASYAIKHALAGLQARYADLPEMNAYLQTVRQDIVTNVDRFLYSEDKAAQAQGAAASQRNGWFTRYQVNLLVDRAEQTGAPVIVEMNPTHRNLLGSIEHRAPYGTWLTDFTMIKAGALHRANGGYLVLDAQRLLTHPHGWEALKRALRTEKAPIEEPNQGQRPVPAPTLDPEPIPLQLKVVLIGDPDLYYELRAWDDEFGKLFKVKADFDVRMPLDETHVIKYAHFIADRCHKEGLAHFTPEAVGRVVAYGARLDQDRRKLSTRFAAIADLVREASYWSRQQGHELVGADDIAQAINEHTRRHNRYEERLQELITDGTIMIDTTGQVIGQVNGLAVLWLGDYTFGQPSRITAKTYLGRAGVVNIDREVKLTESIHDKGLLILASYLRSKYGQQKPLSLSANLVFEQGYEGVSGDSASSPELYALLSSITRLPLKQNIAATGSVNQHGQIQAVGGVIPKVEGFFDVCKRWGLTGDQGVILPRANVHNLVLRPDILEAVESGQFHLYAVRNIDEGIEILTGVEAGEAGPDGTYPEGTVNRLVADRLSEMTDQMEQYGGNQDEDDEEEEAATDQEETPEPDLPLPSQEGDSDQEKS
jgi:predicted ATP-dependent protease